MKHTLSTAADAVVIKNNQILLVKRNGGTFAGMWSLPGGFVEKDETVEDACLRELEEETGLKGKHLTLVGVYSAPDRDPRGRVISIAYLVKYISGDVDAGDDAAMAHWFKIEDLPKLAFDHKEIINDAVQTINKQIKK